MVEGVLAPEPQFPLLLNGVINTTAHGSSWGDSRQPEPGACSREQSLRWGVRYLQETGGRGRLNAGIWVMEGRGSEATGKGLPEW